jgi:DNA-binding MarR family transcriptional regulator
LPCRRSSKTGKSFVERRADMSPKPTLPSEIRTPQARLSEAGVHALVGYQLAQASIVTNQVFDDHAGADGLRKVEFTLLALVQGNPGVTARQLARALAVTPPNIAIWMDKLERRGLVARQRSESDARMQHVRLTKAGATLVDRSMQALLEGEQQALASLTPGERTMLVELLHKVAMARRATIVP